MGRPGAGEGWSAASPRAGRRPEPAAPGRLAAAEPGRLLLAPAGAGAPGRRAQHRCPTRAQLSLPLRCTQRPEDPWSNATFVSLQVTVSTQYAVAEGPAINSAVAARRENACQPAC